LSIAHLQALDECLLGHVGARDFQPSLLPCHPVLLPRRHLRLSDRITCSSYPFNCSATKGEQWRNATWRSLRLRHSAMPSRSMNDTSARSWLSPLPAASTCSHQRRSSSTQGPLTRPANCNVTACQPGTVGERQYIASLRQ